LAQTFCRLTGAVFLNEIQGDAEQHHHGDDEKVGHFAGQCRNRAGDQ
jgi:hypothetical protein